MTEKVMLKQLGNHGFKKHTTGYPFFSGTKKRRVLKIFLIKNLGCKQSYF